MAGSTDTAKRTVFPGILPDGDEVRQGDWVAVKIVDFSHNTLIGKPLNKISLRDWNQQTEGSLPFMEEKRVKEVRE